MDTLNCGFLSLVQQQVAAYVPVPVATSSLIGGMLAIPMGKIQFALWRRMRMTLFTIVSE